MPKRKYIVVDAGGHEMIFTFPDVVMHFWMLEAVRTLRQGVPDNWCRPYMGAVCVGAGFVTSDGVCFGRSESLKIDSRPALDTALLQQLEHA